MIYADITEIPKGFSGKITEVLITGAFRRRLAELGFIKGATVTALGKGIGGKTGAYLVRGTVIALRKNDAVRIKAEVRDDG